MSKTIFLIIFFSLTLISNNDFYAQEINGMPVGPIPKLKFGEREVTHESKLNSVTASLAYGHSSIQEFTLSLPIPSATPFTLLTQYTSSGFLSSMCKGGDGKYYMTEIYFVPPLPSASLYELNPVNGVLTLLGSISGLGTEMPNGIAYNPADGTYYLCTDVSLYSLDIITRVATYIGSFGLADGIMIDLCFDQAGTCYAIAIGSATAYTIDITTGFPTLLGSLGYYAIYGHGMSYDYETSTIYISAYNHDAYSGQLRIMDPQTGNTNLVTDWGWEQIAPFALDSYYGPPCPVSSPFNPYPANGLTGVSIYENELAWTNGGNTTNVEVWFGTPGNIIKVYDGLVISNWNLDTLNYSTTYNWRIVCKNDSCSITGPYWSFQTLSDSSTIFYEPFNNLDCWTAIGPQGIQNWFLSYTNFASGSPTSEVKLKGWDYNNFNGLSQLISCQINDDSYHYIVKIRHLLDVYSGSTWQYIGLAVSYDGGVSKEIIWQTPISGDMGPEEIETEFYPSANTFQMIIYFNGVSLQINNWFVDDLKLIDDCMECFPPATPTWAHAIRYYYPLRVILFWNDNSWNEEGFKIFRKKGFPEDSTQYELIGSVLENHNNFTDLNVSMDSTYTYKVLAYNQWGESDSSNTATITMIPVPVELTSFTAKAEKSIVILSWSTATELNNLGFEIERKTTGEFYTIGFKEGHGSTTEIQNYSFEDKYVENGINFYRLKQIDFNGNHSSSEEIELDYDIPKFFSLEQNYPNPFNPSTTIKYVIPEKSFVSIKVFDMSGNEVVILVNEAKPSGSYEVEFNASSAAGGLTSGIYFYQLRAGQFLETKKMILLK
jgi:hypothetical protein